MRSLQPVCFPTDMIDLHSFLPEDPKEAKRVFNSLLAEQQFDIILNRRGRERIRALFLFEHPRELIQRLPELEVYLTLREVGEKDCLDLISLTTPEQWQYVLDLEFWKKDALDSLLRTLDREVPLSTIFLTSLANQILKGRFQFESVKSTQLRELFSQLFERDEKGRGESEWRSEMDGKIC
ncbi:MAG: DUF6178 family protein [Thermodesulfobacteriota bacterium]